MNIYDEFKDVYVGELTESEHQELAKFASALIQIRSRSDGASARELIKQAAEEIYDIDDIQNITNLTSFIKTSSSARNWSRAASLMTIGGALIGTVAPLVQGAIKHRNKEKKLRQSLGEVLKEHPNLSNPTVREQTVRNFDALKTFAPDIAGNSLVAGNALQRMHRAGPALLDIPMVNELAATQKDISAVSNSKGGRAVNPISEVGNLVGFAGKAVNTVNSLRSHPSPQNSEGKR